MRLNIDPATTMIVNKYEFTQCYVEAASGSSRFLPDDVDNSIVPANWRGNVEYSLIFPWKSC
jgi:hypothetical protein